MQSQSSQPNEYKRSTAKQAWIITLIFASLVFMRNLAQWWAFSFGYYRDSNLYVSLGQTLFQRGGPFARGVVSFPYPFLNAVSQSWVHPGRLVFLQILIGAIAAGVLLYVIARSDRLLAVLAGILLLLDLVWGAINRNVMTEGLFVSFNVLSLVVLVSHHQRRKAVSAWELFLAGILYGWTFIFRPSSLFLTILIIPLYLWLTGSWRKTASLAGGFLAIFLALGSFNAWSSGEFRLMGQSGYYTGSPLFVYRLFLPENGPASQELDRYLSSCMPGEDYANMMETSAGGTVNNEILYGKFIPCLQSHDLSLDQASDLMTQAYVEGITNRPVYYAGVITAEGIRFLRYNVPLILRFYLKPEQNNRCTEYPWCESIRHSRYSWGAGLPLARFYERAATKAFQVYLLGIQPLGIFLPEASPLPVAAAWLIMIIFLLVATRGSMRFLVIACLLWIHYLILSVVAGYGFLERYSSVLTPFYIILSAATMAALIRIAWGLAIRIRQSRLFGR